MQSQNKLQRRLTRLELVHLSSMVDSVADFYKRVPSKAKWTVDLYPTGSEKELYAEFAHIILSDLSLRTFLTAAKRYTVEQLQDEGLIKEIVGYWLVNKFRISGYWRREMGANARLFAISECSARCCKLGY